MDQMQTSPYLMDQIWNVLHLSVNKSLSGANGFLPAASDLAIRNRDLDLLDQPQPLHVGQNTPDVCLGALQDAADIQKRSEF